MLLSSGVLRSWNKRRTAPADVVNALAGRRCCCYLQRLWVQSIRGKAWGVGGLVGWLVWGLVVVTMNWWLINGIKWEEMAVNSIRFSLSWGRKKILKLVTVNHSRFPAQQERNNNENFPYNERQNRKLSSNRSLSGATPVPTEPIEIWNIHFCFRADFHLQVSCHSNRSLKLLINSLWIHQRPPTNSTVFGPIELVRMYRSVCKSIAKLSIQWQDSSSQINEIGKRNKVLRC